MSLRRGCDKGTSDGVIVIRQRVNTPYRVVVQGKEIEREHDFMIRRKLWPGESVPEDAEVIEE